MTAPRSRLTRGLLAASILVVPGLAQEKLRLDDPPVPPRPRAHPRATLHAAPRPLSPHAVTSDWTEFPGPQGRSASPETMLARDLGGDGTQGPPLVWELSKGNGYAAPAIQGERLVVFHRLGDEEVVECLNPERPVLYWSFRYPTDYRDAYGYSNGPRCSPVISGDLVYTYGVQGKLHALDLESGALVWKRDLSSEFEVPQDFFGVVSTPALYADTLIVHVGAPGGPTVVALDRETGETRWTSGKRWQAGYATPILGRVHGEMRCFVFAGGKSRPPSGGLMSLDPDTGEIDFEFPWRSETYESVNASSPVLVGDRVFVSASYDTGGALLELEPGGGFQVAWTSPVLSTHFNTPLHEEGHLYGFDGRNEPDASLVCQELATGREVWREVLEWEETYELHGTTKARPMGVYRGSLLAVDGNYLCLGERGHLLWLDLGPKGCRVIDRAWLFAAHETWTPLVVSRGLLYVAQNSKDFIDGTEPRFLCYDLRGSEE